MRHVPMKGFFGFRFMLSVLVPTECTPAFDPVAHYRNARQSKIVRSLLWVTRILTLFDFCSNHFFNTVKRVSFQQTRTP